MTAARRASTIPTAASDRMRAQGRHDTLPELELRRALYALGLRYRIHRRPIADLRREADITFARARVAIFVDGCFWHGCPVHATWPKDNAAFWAAKIAENRARDRDTDRRLRAAGWVAFRVWEHEDPVDSSGRIRRVVSKRVNGDR